MSIIGDFKKSQKAEIAKEVISAEKEYFASGELNNSDFYLINPQVFERVGIDLTTWFKTMHDFLDYHYVAEKNIVEDEFTGKMVNGVRVGYENEDGVMFDVCQYDAKLDRWFLTKEIEELGITKEDLPIIDGQPSMSNAEHQQAIEPKDKDVPIIGDGDER